MCRTRTCYFGFGVQCVSSYANILTIAFALQDAQESNLQPLERQSNVFPSILTPWCYLKERTGIEYTCYVRS